MVGSSNCNGVSLHSQYISNTLKNPAYAGTFVYGKTRTSRTGPSAIDKVTRKLSQEQWKSVIPNKYSGYISTELFDTIQNMIKKLFRIHSK
jgi:hypothetical protein